MTRGGGVLGRGADAADARGRHDGHVDGRVGRAGEGVRGHVRPGRVRAEHLVHVGDVVPHAVAPDALGLVVECRGPGGVDVEALALARPEPGSSSPEAVERRLDALVVRNIRRAVDDDVCAASLLLQ